MARRPITLLLPLLCGCSLMIPRAYDSVDADADVGGDADAVEMTEDGLDAIPDGSEDPPEDVPDDVEDDDGIPDTPCRRAYLDRQHYGCEFWTVPLPIDSLPGAGSWEFGIILSNVSGEEIDVSVLLDGSEVEGRHVGIDSSVHIGVPLIAGQSDGFVLDSWNSLAMPDGAYYIVTTGPVAAWQINPRHFMSSTVNALHSSATLLLPEPLLSTSHRVLAMPPLSTHDTTLDQLKKRASYISIVGTSDVTELTITAGGPIAPGSGMPGRAEGETFDHTIGTGEVLHLAASVPADCDEHRPMNVLNGDIRYCPETGHDLSGTQIGSTQPVAVFVGSVGVNVPFDVETFDHVAEQLPPLETLGTSFVTAPMTASGESGVYSIVRVLSVSGGTTYNVNPPQGGVGSGALAENEVLEFTVETPVHFSTSGPVLAAQYLVGSEYGTSGTRPIGDPAMTWLVPEEQWADSYAFETVPEYANATGGSEVYVLIAKKTGTSVTYDGSTITPGGWVAVGTGGEYQVAWMLVEEGIHFIEGTGVAAAHLWGLGPGVGMAHPLGTMLDTL